MKKTYQFPVVKVVQLQTMKMLCESLGIGGNYAGDKIQSRRFGGFLDEDDEE